MARSVPISARPSHRRWARPSRVLGRLRTGRPLLPSCRPAKLGPCGVAIHRSTIGPEDHGVLKIGVCAPANVLRHLTAGRASASEPAVLIQFWRCLRVPPVLPQPVAAFHRPSVQQNARPPVQEVSSSRPCQMVARRLSRACCSRTRHTAADLDRCDRSGDRLAP
jgi:hypothetical protein